MSKISKVQKLNFSVVRKHRKKFFAVFAKGVYNPNPQQKFYDNAIYFESLSVDALPVGGKVEIYRSGSIIDNCTIELKGPGGSDGFNPEFTFKKFRKRNHKSHLEARSLQEGDRISIDWELNDREFDEISKFLKNQDLAGAIKLKDVPIYVERYFVSRIGFRQEVERFFFPFTLYCSVLGSSV